MKDISFAFDSRDGRRVVVGLDTKGTCIGSSSPKEDAMPLPHRRAGDTSRIRSLSSDRRRPFRAMDEGEDPVEFIRELIGQLEPEELERLGSGDRRRTARDEPPPFPGRPNPGGEMDPIFDKYWRRPGEDRKHAADRRRFAHDEHLDRHKDAKHDFEMRFPGTLGIRVMG
jgi:hypothetical protein